MNFEQNIQKTKKQKKITKARLKNIGLYYLQRFETSVQNLKNVLKRRVDKYALSNPDFDKQEAYEWIEELVEDFKNWHYVDDARFAEMKIKDYLSAGKSEKYIKLKLKQKGIKSHDINTLISNAEYNPKEFALRLALKKKIGPYRADEKERKENLKKDMGILLRAGFDYDVVCDILNQHFEE